MPIPKILAGHLQLDTEGGHMATGSGSAANLTPVPLWLTSAGAISGIK